MKRRDAVRRVVILCVAASLSACAYTDYQVTVEDADVPVQVGQVARPENLVFVRGEISDDRPEPGRVGYKRNGFNEITADVLLDEPVGDVVMDALVRAVETNGHRMATEGLEISGSVTRLLIDVAPQTWVSRGVADIEMILVLRDTATSQEVFRETYHASYIEREAPMTAADVYEPALTGALSALVDEIVFDDRLADTLAAWSGSRAPAQ